MQKSFLSRFPVRIQVIDSHTAGESTRLVVAGEEPAPGGSMKDKLEDFKTRFDHIRLLLTREPRGSRDGVVAYVTEPTTPGADFGLLYMDSMRYMYLCGHATIGAVASLLETGSLSKTGERLQVIVDTPSGPMKTHVVRRGDRVESVTIQTPPSFVYQTDLNLDVPGRGSFRVDTVCVGGFFVMINAKDHDLDISPANAPNLIPLGMEIIEAANANLEVRHPEREEVKTVDVVEFYDKSDLHTGSGVVVYGESHLDRSPCGTGTAAKLTLFRRLGLIKPGDVYTNAGPLGTTFEARIIDESFVGDLPAVVVEIKGSAYITGLSEFVLDPKDPFPQGYTL